MKIRFDRKASESLVSNKLIVIVLAILVIAVILFFSFKANILEWLRNLPEWQYEGDKDVEVSGGDNKTLEEECPIKVARILGNEIKFCGNDVCSNKNLISSKLYISGESERKAEIYISIKGLDEKIGDIENKRTTILPEILEGKGGIFLKVMNDLPDIVLLCNLNGSEYHAGNILCRDKKLSKEEIEKRVKSTTIEGKTYYYDIDEFIKIKSSLTNLTELPLYLDSALTEKAKEYVVLGDENKPYVITENLATPVELISTAGGSYINLNLYLDKYFSGDIKNLNEQSFLKKEPFSIIKRFVEAGNIIDTKDKEISSVEFIYFRDYGGRIYIRFAHDTLALIPITDFGAAKTNWILLDYWNEHRTFIRAPEWALLK